LTLERCEVRGRVLGPSAPVGYVLKSALARKGHGALKMIEIGNATILQGDCLEMLKQLPDESVQCCVTSPPYWGLRDYGVAGQIGLESSLDEFVSVMTAVFREVWRVLRKDGTCWVNLGDSYASDPGKGSGNPDPKNPGHGGKRCRTNDLKPKDLIGVPWRVAFALQADGWYLRQDIIWSKPNPMPESVRDRCTKAHEYLFLLTKSERYFFDSEAIKEQCTQDEFANGFRGGCYVLGAIDNQEVGKRQNVGNKRYSFARTVNQPDCRKPQHREDREDVLYQGRRNKRSVWTVATQGFSGAHFATYPPKLIEPCILAGARAGDTVLDPFNGSGTTGIVALKHGRRYIGVELNPEYVALSVPRLQAEQEQMKLAL
jgi:DNA modification methylase